MHIKSSIFSKKLISWYLHHKRDLPWRKVKDPYKIWLSEIILQQTRVDQGLPYYQKFIEAFPSIEKLANAPESRVLKLWQGLGYYSRARNLHFTAKFVNNSLSGNFPSTYAELIKLKGIGDYTASAIASICFNEPTAVVDGNVYRFLSRFFGVDTPINTSRAKKEFKLLAQNLIDIDQPGTFNQAIMEFGARQCVPRNPDCKNCIYNDSCVALKEKKVARLPFKNTKTKITNRYFNYIVVVSENDRTKLVQRIQKGIWQKLYEFPLIESSSKIDKSELIKTNSYVELASEIPIRSLNLYNTSSIIHKLSHQHLHTDFWVAETEKLDESNISISKVKEYAVPTLIENFISDFSVFNN